MSQGRSEPALAAGGEAPVAGVKPTRFRWVICGLLFFATTINYIDRSTLNTLEPTLRGAIGWQPYQYGLIGAAFSLAYGLGFLVMGNVIDKIGTRAGYALALIGWSLAGIATAFTSTPFSFGAARFMLGLFEAGNFPAAIKTVSEWFPQKQRATATGIFNAGSNVGAVCAPLIALCLLPLFGWRAAFFVTPVLAAVWIFLWLKYYRNPAQQPRANDAERALIEADPIVKSAPVKWRNLLAHRQAWAFMAGKFLTDPVWWFYLFWSGAFFADRFHAKLSGVALPLIYIYVLADFGSIAGGWLSSYLIKKGRTPNFSRKIAMSVCAAFVMPVIFAPMVPAEWPGGLWIAATLIGFAAAAHQGFSANIFTTTSDMFPKRAVSSITGLGGVAGAMGSMILQSVAGVTLELTHSYVILFVIAACAYPLAVGIFHAFAPRMEPVREGTLESTPMPRLVTVLLFAVLGFIVGVPCSYWAQNTTDYRLYDMKTMVTTTFGDEFMNGIKEALKGKVKDIRVVEQTLTEEQKASLRNQAPSLDRTRRKDAILWRSLRSEGENADLLQLLNHQRVQAVGILIELTDDPTPADREAVRVKTNYMDLPFATKDDEGPPMFVMPFMEVAPAALRRFPKGMTFTEYLAAVLPPGNIYKSMDREELLGPLAYVSGMGILLGGLLGAMLHGFIFRSSRAKH